RLRRARAEGDSPVSAALGQSLGLLVAILLTPAALAATAGHAADLLRSTLARKGPMASAGAAELSAEALAAALDVARLAAPLVAAVAFTAVLVGLVQTGGVVSAARLAPALDRLDPFRGLSNLFSRERFFSLARALVATALAALVTASVLRGAAADLAATAGNERAALPLVLAAGKKLGVLVALTGLGLALVDRLVVERGWKRRHRMSKDEIRREFREAEGDPEVRARRKRAHQEALAGSIVNAVREATVVIVNPTHLASALRYVEELDDAPKLVAQGEGELARRIVEAAHAYGIPCIRDVPVARALRELEIGDEIPEALYEAVAEILRAVIDRQARPGAPPGDGSASSVDSGAGTGAGPR
ncbi:MAG TPA: EscU/YscU/HrcU family type III secretion system export apparatus switch protein, partial [Polyangiaceae bacterium]|nr:EscU/YscU/HrcU family type III secretion system export apparatus switch protein [Polyangiaceae bacterium]